MGKSSRSKRFGAFKPSPTGLLSEKDLQMSMQMEGDHLTQNVPGIVATIIEKLQAPSPEERACGCQMMASIVCQSKAIDILLKLNIVKITAPLFQDASTDVQKNALGALRNMSVFGEEKVCDVMVKEDIFTSLSGLIKKFGNGWAPEKEPEKQATTETLIEAVELSSNLCENSVKALQLFNSEGIITVLLPMLQVEIYGYPLSCAVARCLHVVSENNPEVLKLLQLPDVVTGLGNVVMTKTLHVNGVLFRVLTAGVLLNLTDVNLSPYFDSIIQMAGEVLDMDCLPLISSAMEKLKEAEKNEDYDSEKLWPDVDQLLSAQSTCLELLANLCCSDDEWEEMDGSEEDISDDNQACGTSQTVSMVEDSESSPSLSSEVHCALTKHDILSKILEKATSLESEKISQLQGLKYGKAIFNKLEDLQSRALLCLSNMISALDESSLSQFPVAIPGLWSRLYTLGKSGYVSENEDFRWAITSAMRAVLQRMAELHSNDIKSVSESDLDFLVSLGTQCQNTETQINVIKILSTIGCVLSVDVSSFPVLKIIGNILIQVSCSNPNLIVIAEALDSIFDVFKEDETDPVAREIGLVEKLKSLQPTFKARVSSERKKLGENYGLVMMARTNLNGFLKYKASKR